MFEKEAKKHKEEFITTYINVGGGLNAADMIGMQKEQSYQEGAEFGYNKANEWHKVADGDLPKDARYVWTNVGAGYHDDDGWWDDFGRLQNVIAWCEPKFEE